jgi:uncharacterized protein (TIGR03435 family)
MTVIESPGSRLARLHLESSRTSMKTLAEMLSVGVVDRPVVDMTGLTGNYEVAADLSQEDMMKVAAASMTFGPRGGGDSGRNGPWPSA